MEWHEPSYERVSNVPSRGPLSRRVFCRINRGAIKFSREQCFDFAITSAASLHCSRTSPGVIKLNTVQCPFEFAVFGVEIQSVSVSSPALSIVPLIDVGRAQINDDGEGLPLHEPRFESAFSTEQCPFEFVVQGAEFAIKHGAVFHGCCTSPVWEPV